MPAQWIAARLARKLIVDFHEQDDGLERFKGHLQSGAVKSRAGRYHCGESVRSDFEMPDAFWCDGAFDQIDWNDGSFEADSGTTAIDICFDLEALVLFCSRKRGEKQCAASLSQRMIGGFLLTVP